MSGELPCTMECQYLGILVFGTIFTIYGRMMYTMYISGYQAIEGPRLAGEYPRPDAGVGPTKYSIEHDVTLRTKTILHLPQRHAERQVRIVSTTSRRESSAATRDENGLAWPRLHPPTATLQVKTIDPSHSSTLPSSLTLKRPPHSTVPITPHRLLHIMPRHLQQRIPRIRVLPINGDLHHLGPLSL
jgi:hypothetical protein